MFPGQIDKENIEFSLGRKTKAAAMQVGKVAAGGGLALLALKKGGASKLGKSIGTGFKRGVKQTSQTQSGASRLAGGIKGAASRGSKTAYVGAMKAGKSIGTNVSSAVSKAKTGLQSSMQKNRNRAMQRKKLENGIRAGLK
jgi:hypothetical protein